MTNIKLCYCVVLGVILGSAACSEERPVATADGGKAEGSPSRGRVVADASVSDVLPQILPADARSQAEFAPDLFDQVPDALVRVDLREIPDSLADAQISRSDTQISIPDVQSSVPDVGKEVAGTCSASCFQGCYSGCGSDGQCKACPTCTCEVVTGICHC